MKKFFKHLKEIIFKSYQRTDLPNGYCCLCRHYGEVTTLFCTGGNRFCLNCASEIMEK